MNVRYYFSASRCRSDAAARAAEGGRTREMATKLSSWNRAWRGSKPLVHTLRFQGVIQAGRGSGGGLGPKPLSLEGVEKDLERAFNPKVMPDAVAITVNSPGGSPVQSDLIYTRIAALAKETGIPVMTFAEDVAASGGYYLMCAGRDGMYCRDTSVVGSIGVVSGSFGFVDAIKRLGVERRVYTSGKSKVQLDPFLPEKEEDLAMRQRILNDIHESFKAIVATSRGDKLKLTDDRTFSGEVFTGREAVTHGLCDAVGDVRGVMREKFGDKVRFKHFGGPKNLLDSLPVGKLAALNAVSLLPLAAAMAAGGMFSGGGGAATGAAAADVAADVAAASGIERRLVEAALHTVEERMAFWRYEP